MLSLDLPDDLKISTVKNITASIPLTCCIVKRVKPISIGIKIGRVNNTFHEFSFPFVELVASLKINKRHLRLSEIEAPKIVSYLSFETTTELAGSTMVLSFSQSRDFFAFTR